MKFESSQRSQIRNPAQGNLSGVFAFWRVTPFFPHLPHQNSQPLTIHIANENLYRQNSYSQKLKFHLLLILLV